MIPPERSPLRLYQKLFVADTAAAKAEAERLLADDRSLLDDLRDRVKRLQAKVNPADRDRLDQYLTAVRELEQRLARSQSWLGVDKPKVAAKAPGEISNHDDLPANMKVMFDLVRMALETDSCRVVTVYFSLTGTVVNSVGAKTETHELTHHGGTGAKVDELRKIEEAEFTALGGLLAGLSAAKEAGTPLLDRTSVLFGTNMGSANAHSNTNLPVLLAGGGFKHAGHLAFDTKKNHHLATLYVSLLQRMGVAADTFASATGTMKGLEIAG